MNPEFAGRPTLVSGNTLRLYPGMIRLNENVAINVKNRSYSATAEIVVGDDGGGDGAILAQGGRTGGWAFFAQDGNLGYHYSYCGLERTTALSEQPIGSGTYQVRAEFAYDGGGIGRGGTVTLFIDGTGVGDAQVNLTHPMYFSFDEALDVGTDTGMPVYEEYRTPADGSPGRSTGPRSIWASTTRSTSSTPRNGSPPRCVTSDR